ncbi:MAG: peptidylprolyl isomerase [Bacteroidota bacterium]
MKKILFSLITVSLFVSCGDKNKDYLVKIKTSYGDMTVVLYDETPLHKKNFLTLANAGKYDSTIFHRVIENFMIQGGNVAEKEGIPEKEEDRLPAEIVDGFYHTRGTLAAARQPDQVNPDKMSSSTQFYIVDGNSWEMMSTDINRLYQEMVGLLQDSTNSELIEEYRPIYSSGDRNKVMDFIFSKREMVEEKKGIDLSKEAGTGNDEAYEAAGGGAPHLDGEYTVFGKVIEGLDIIDKIAAVEKTINPATRQKSKPVDPIYLKMEVVEMKKKDITEKYGYAYPEE